MIKEKTENIFRQYPDTRIVFFWDPDKNYMDEFSQLKEDDGIKAIEAGEQYFSLKYRLENELQEHKVLLYHPFPKPSGRSWEAYPLLGLYYANKELGVDEVAEIMEAYKLKLSQQQLVKDYIHLLKHKTNQQKLAKILDPAVLNESSLKLGLVSIALDFTRVADPEQCLIKLLIYTTQQDKLTRSIERIRNFKAEQVVLAWMGSRLGFNMPELSPENVKRAAQNLKYNLIMRHISDTQERDTYSRLKINRTSALNKIFALYKEWESHRQFSGSIKEVMDETAVEIDESKLIEVYGVDAEYGYYSDKMLRCILKDSISRMKENPQLIRDEVIKWKDSKDIEESINLEFNFVFHASALYSILKQYNTFRFDRAEEFIKVYTDELHRIDFHYRKANSYYTRLQEKSSSSEYLDEHFDYLSNDYDRYLITLNVEWQKLLQESNFDLHSIELPKQSDFYKDHINDFDSKVAVIISDAFRFEAGYELFEELLTDKRNKVEVQLAMASIPSDTRHGMTNLLGGKECKVQANDQGVEYSINGISTNLTENRASILKALHKESDAVKWSKIGQYKEKEGRDYFKKYKRVYIYHDWIDAIGDSAKTETGTFNAVREAIDQILVIIRKLNSWNVSHVFVTADHGFIYNQKKLTDSSRQDYPKAKKLIKKHARFAIGQGFTKKDGYFFPMRNTSVFDTDLEVAIPKAINRYRKSGYIGVQFSHGGASLQELVLPVVKCYRKKQEVAEQVDFKRLDSQKRITTGSIKIQLFQDQPVTSKRKPKEIVIGLYDEKGRKLSNEELVLFDGTSGNPKERTREAILTLNTASSGKNLAYLRAYDASDTDKLNPQVINEKLIISRPGETDFDV